MAIHCRRRFTPTGVGNTGAVGGGGGGLPVHPHGRGEYFTADTAGVKSIGSPPRAWGILQHHSPGPGIQRFTPTGVGNTGSGPGQVPSGSVHPHGRGEYSAYAIKSAARFGSPPRAWGIHNKMRGNCLSERFTPTGVGNTLLWTPFATPRTVHPHGRGEYLHYASVQAHFNGSPPRAWGILAVALGVSLSVRFTPTGVGNTLEGPDPQKSGTVHPHGRGEYRSPHPPRPGIRGSPPRAWGIRHLERVHPVHIRFTPTGVGNTAQAAHLPPAQTVHPHGRGEYSTTAQRRICPDGSPPRAWGILVLLFAQIGPGRFTPTGVGNTLTNQPNF